MKCPFYPFLFLPLTTFLFFFSVGDASFFLPSLAASTAHGCRHAAPLRHGRLRRAAPERWPRGREVVATAGPGRFSFPDLWQSRAPQGRGVPVEEAAGGPGPGTRGRAAAWAREGFDCAWGRRSRRLRQHVRQQTAAARGVAGRTDSGPRFPISLST